MFWNYTTFQSLSFSRSMYVSQRTIVYGLSFSQSSFGALSVVRSQKRIRGLFEKREGRKREDLLANRRLDSFSQSLACRGDSSTAYRVSYCVKLVQRVALLMLKLDCRAVMR